MLRLRIAQLSTSRQNRLQQQLLRWSIPFFRHRRRELQVELTQPWNQALPMQPQLHLPLLQRTRHCRAQIRRSPPHLPQLHLLPLLHPLQLTQQALLAVFLAGCGGSSCLLFLLLSTSCVEGNVSRYKDGHLPDIFFERSALRTVLRSYADDSSVILLASTFATITSLLDSSQCYSFIIRTADVV